jgi:hypothetical protein
MALDPRIPLGVQPVQQQPNMLGQYAQVMAIKAAQQEMEGNEGIRGALSQGVPDDPTTLLQYGKQGRATYESLLKGKKEQIDSAAKTLTMAGQIAGYVRDNPTPENFVSAVGTMVQSGVLTRAQAERVIADAGNDPTKIKSYAERTASDALTEADRLSARTRIQAANIGAGPGYQRNALERKKYENQLAAGGDIVTTTIPDPENPRERIEIQTRRDLRTGQLIPLEVQPPPMRIDISPSSATSAYQPPSVGGAGGVNALNPQNGAAPAPNVNALNPNAPQQQAPTGPTFARPKSKSENLTEAQGKGTMFSTRAKQAHEILNAIGQDGKVQPGLIKRSAEAIPFVGEGLGTALNFTQSEAQQQVEQAQRNFINALLRQESGAVISPSEFDNARKQYFPQPGDGPKVIEQKRLNREAVIQGLDVVAGPGAKKTTPPSTEPKKISSMDEYNSLPSGATYIDPEGTTRRKK